MHARTQVRDKVLSALTDLETTGERVYKNSPHQIDQLQLPCIRVVIGNEGIIPLTYGSESRVKRSLSVDIYGVSRTDTDIDAALDQIAAEVEVAMFDAFSPTTIICQLIAISRNTDFSEMVIGEIVLHYDMGYITASNNPEVVIT
jgi:hypothetical protein